MMQQNKLDTNLSVNASNERWKWPSNVAGCNLTNENNCNFDNHNQLVTDWEYLILKQHWHLININIDISPQCINILYNFHVQMLYTFQKYAPIPVIDEIVSIILIFAGLNKKANIKPISLTPYILSLCAESLENRCNLLPQAGILCSLWKITCTSKCPYLER